MSDMTNKFCRLFLKQPIRGQWLLYSANQEATVAIPRGEQIDTESGGYYHLVSRCVRRAFLCGKDSETGRNYDYRRDWIENRILELATIFSIEVYSYAVMSNHYHLVVYSDPKLPQTWSDIEVAERWLKAFPGKLSDSKFVTQRILRI